MKFLFLLLFSIASVKAAVQFEKSFLFGVANAPGQVEDQLDDIWLDFALKGKIAAWSNYHLPNDRVRFWSQPQIDIQLAAKAHVEVFRMGIDWGRVMPTPDSFDENAIHRYHEIINLVRKNGMKVMLTIMHHSVPKWAQEEGGWTNRRMIGHFQKFSERMISEFHQDVEFWITFNEGNIFALHAYTDGLWPPMSKASLLSMLALGPIRGRTVKAMDRMAEAHNLVYESAHNLYPDIKIGLAHNMGFYSGKTHINRLKARISGKLMNWRFPNRIRGHMDFFGFNYYGAEWFKGNQIDVDPEEEYSEAGRAIYPEGLYDLLHEIHGRFPDLPIMITENGISDETDILRPAFIIEHLMAVHKAIAENVPVKGYFIWTMTDNLEWSDGYCPKFGFVGVDRKNNFKRILRPSYNLFTRINEGHLITDQMRNEAWNLVVTNWGKERPFCRHEDGMTGLDNPVPRKIVEKDWRFLP